MSKPFEVLDEKRKPFRPMLMSNQEVDLDTLPYGNITVSPKLDGVRCIITNKGIFNRSMKPIPNIQIQKEYEFVSLMLRDNEIMEGELYKHGLPCREIAGICNSKTKDTQGVTFHLFLFHNGKKIIPFRLETKHLFSRLEGVLNIPVKNKQELKTQYQLYLNQGYEGAVIRVFRKDFLYKQGRLTSRDQIMWKLKPSREDDLQVIGVTERMKNTNPSKKNELGHSFKRNTINQKEPTGIASSFIVELPNGMTSKVTITGDEASRREIWDNQSNYIGGYVVVKSMDYGVKDKLRHPRMIGFKMEIEK